MDDYQGIFIKKNKNGYFNKKEYCNIDNDFIFISSIRLKKIIFEKYIIFIDGMIDEKETRKTVENIFHKKKIICSYPFSIIVYDTIHKEISIISDTFRTRPIYYTENNNVVMFSSNITKLLSYRKEFDIKMDWISVIMNNSYSTNSNNIWINIKETKPQQVLTINKDGVQDYTYEMCDFETNVDYNTLLMECLCENKDTIAAISLSGGIDSMLLSKIYNKPSYSLSGSIFDITGEKEIIKKFVREYNIVHKFVQVPEISIETIENYTNMLKAFGFPNFNLEQFYKSILCQQIYLDLGNCTFATGQGSDELFGGYSCNYKTYREYITAYKNRMFFDDSKKSYIKMNFFNKEYILDDYFNEKSERKWLLELEFKKLIYNALVTDDFCARYNSLNNISPYINIKMYKYMERINGEELYDKKIFRNFVSEIIGMDFGKTKKNPFIYNKRYYLSYLYIKELLTYRKASCESLLDIAFDSSEFKNGILNKQFIESFSISVINEDNVKSNFELIEVLLKIVNALILCENFF